MKAKSVFNFFLISLSALALSGCATSFDVATDYDDEYQFSGKSRFALVIPDKMQTVVDDLTKNRIENALVSQLQAKGFEQTEQSNADILVSYFGTINRARDIQIYETYNTYFHYLNCFRCRPLSLPETEVRQVDYTEGNLMIDIVDPKTNTLKWRGRTQAKLSTSKANSLDPQQRVELVNKAVAAILAKYPPNSKK